MQFLKFGPAAFLALMSTGASAQCTSNRCDDVLVERIFVNNTDVAIQTSGDHSNLDCEGGMGTYIRFFATEPANANWYAMVLTAANLGVPLSFRLEIGTGPCEIVYITQDL